MNCYGSVRKKEKEKIAVLLLLLLSLSTEWIKKRPPIRRGKSLPREEKCVEPISKQLVNYNLRTRL